ncbi:hypothetical protein TIFTF001_040124 [Ficus carica]|uniref:Uncharacterized protein n=1 Tax=Ficus carica TaxID=3494 RepID=A0AA87Z9H9_FICCA|nr:hypothetical protein TIFTF001_040124 [Ficus carica]
MGLRAIFSFACGHVPAVPGPEEHGMKPLLEDPVCAVAGDSSWAEPGLEFDAGNEAVLVAQ